MASSRSVRGAGLVAACFATWLCLAGVASADPTPRHVRLPIGPHACAGCHRAPDSSLTWAQQVTATCLGCHGEPAASSSAIPGTPAVYDSDPVRSGHAVDLPGADPQEATSLHCASCHTFHGRSAGSGLLSPRPGTPTAADGALSTPAASSRWCGSCHPAHFDTSMGGAMHDHAGGCANCHGDPSNGASEDFPHTSSREALLIRYPDALCVGCHARGSLA